jgi:hypothetical protein
LASTILTVSGAIDVHNLPGKGNWACQVKLAGPLSLTFPPAPLPGIPIPGTPLTVRFQVQPIAVLEFGVEDFLNGTGSIPFETSVELGVAAFGPVYLGQAVPFVEGRGAKFDPINTSFGGGFKGYIEGNFGAGLTILFNDVATLSLNGYFEPNFSWDLPLTGCDMTYQLVSRRVGEACVGLQAPPSFPGTPIQLGVCGQFKNEPTPILNGTEAIRRLEYDFDLPVAPGETATLPLLANDNCLGPSFISSTPDCPAYACSVNEPDRQSVNFRAVDVDGGPRAPGVETAQYCVQSVIDQKEHCTFFSVAIKCPPDTKWSDAERACRQCSSPEECACEAPRAWNGAACLCPSAAPVFDAATNACTPCGVEGATYNAATNQCDCGAPRQSDGFRCRCPREAPHYVAETNDCQACPPNMAYNGERCVCVEPAVLLGSGECFPPCGPPSVWDGYECRCPPDVPLEQCFPTPQCTPPSYYSGGACQCPAGLHCIEECVDRVDLCGRLSCPGGRIEPWGSDTFDGSCSCTCDVGN